MLLAAAACACLLCGVVITVVVVSVKHEVHHRRHDPANSVSMAQFRAAQQARAHDVMGAGHPLCAMWSLGVQQSESCVADGGTCVANAEDCDGATQSMPQAVASVLFLICRPTRGGNQGRLWPDVCMLLLWVSEEVARGRRVRLRVQHGPVWLGRGRLPWSHSCLQ